jgi:hypothetical protein
LAAFADGGYNKQTTPDPIKHEKPAPPRNRPGSLLLVDFDALRGCGPCLNLVVLVSLMVIVIWI